MSVARRPSLALLVLLLGLALPAAAQPFQITPVFLPETPLPLPGTGWQVYALHENDAGQLSIGVLRGSQPVEWAVLRRTGTEIEVVAQQGDPAPGLLGGTFDDVYSIGIAPNGDMILLGVGCVPISEELAECNHGIYRTSAAGLVTIALTGQSAPGPGARTFALQQPSSFAIGPAGHIVFTWLLAPDSIDGLFVTNSGGVEVVALQGDPAPGTPHAFTNFFLQEPDVNSAGAIAFEAGIQWSPLETGLFLRTESEVRPVMIPGMAAPGGGTLSGEGQLWSLNDLGNVAFDATLVGGDWGVFVDSDGSLREVVRTGAPIPGTSFTFGQVYGPVIDEHGTVAFYAAGGAPEFPRGIYAELGGQLVPVVVDGTPAPAGVPGTLLDVSRPSLGAGDDILFSANIGEGPEPQVAYFRARLAPQVPGLGAPAAVLLAAALLASARRLRLRRDAQRPARR